MSADIDTAATAAPAPGSSLQMLEALGIGAVWIRRELAAPAAEMQAESVLLMHEPAVESAPLPQAPAAPAVPSQQSRPAVPAMPQLSAPPTRMPALSSDGGRRNPPPAPSFSSGNSPGNSAGDNDGPPSWLDEMDQAGVAVDHIFVPRGEDDEEDDAQPAIDPQIARIAGMEWPELKETVAACRRCGLCNGRKNTVFGVGDEKAKWLFIGEGPGRNEDQQGEPFVGPAGKLLDNMLLAMGLKRGDNAYIANIVKCRPTDDNGKDRPPTPQEIASCMPYLQRQIALIQPTVLVALGKTAALSLLGLDPATPVSKLRGTVHRYQDLPLVVTYHPAYLLRQLGDKGKTWADLCLAMESFSQHTASA
ncbi:uracil-DNA glycosylase [Herbaspirillum lusitanum]|jgi:DNA polymerase|uniref:Type-4 uracil-DNA glycosylase n=1 Tax=Herbaspirillum lusitanum TaxID=213312 RepID=A0ABW9ABD0_9BURK